MKTKTRIVVLLPDIINEKLIDLSREISEGFDTEYTLDKIEVLPHITIGKVFIEDGELDKVVEKIKPVFKKNKGLVIKSRDAQACERWFGVRISPNEIKKIHDQIFEALVDDFEISKIENFDPHVTITRLKQDDSEHTKEVLKVISSWLEDNPIEFALEKIAIGVGDKPHGIFGGEYEVL